MARKRVSLIFNSAIALVLMVSLAACDTFDNLNRDTTEPAPPVTSSGYANYPGHLLEVDNVTYFTAKDHEQGIYYILSIGSEDTQARDVYSMKDPWTLGFISLRYEQDGVLYFTETTFPRDTNHGVYLDVKALDLNAEASAPLTYKPSLAQGLSIPDEVVRARTKDGKLFTLDKLFFVSPVTDKNYAYSLEADGSDLDSAYLFRLDVTNGEAVFFELGALGPTEKWNLVGVMNGVIYYSVTVNGKPKGIYQMDEADSQARNLVEFSGDTYYVDRPRIVENSLYYTQIVEVESSYSGGQRSAGSYPLSISEEPPTISELHRFDLSTKKDTVVMTTENNVQYFVIGDTIYYSERGNLGSCDLNGDNSTVLIKDEKHRKDFLFTSGGWIYYNQSNGGSLGRLYRVNISDTRFPTKPVF